MANSLQLRTLKCAPFMTDCAEAVMARCKRRKGYTALADAAAVIPSRTAVAAIAVGARYDRHIGMQQMGRSQACIMCTM